MPIDHTTDLTVEELKTIIHGLRMSSLAFVEENAIDEIKSMIKALPLPEQIDQMLVNKPISIRNLQKDIGNIMRIIELYGKRDIEYKTRYKSRTGLPPRYKVLDWRTKMKPEVKASVKEMVRISSELDNKGYGEISGSINKFASKVVKDEFDSAEYEKIASSLKNPGLEKEAQMWDKMKGFMGGAMGKVKDMATDIWQAGQAGGLEAQWGALYQKIVEFKKKVDDLAAKAQDPNIKQQMAALSKGIEVGGQQMNQAVTTTKQKTKTPAAAPKGQQAVQQKSPTSGKAPRGVDPAMWNKFMEWQKTQTPATAPAAGAPAPAAVPGA